MRRMNIVMKNETDLVEYMHDYLVELRDSGETNMWGAAPYLSRQFNITDQQAAKILVDWINSFKK